MRFALARKIDLGHIPKRDLLDDPGEILIEDSATDLGEILRHEFPEDRRPALRNLLKKLVNPSPLEV